MEIAESLVHKNNYVKKFTFRLLCMLICKIMVKIGQANINCSNKKLIYYYTNYVYNSKFKCLSHIIDAIII